MPPKVDLTVEPATAQVPPGGRFTFALTVWNRGGDDGHWRIDVIGIPRQWYDLDKPCAWLSPEAGERMQLTVHPSGDPARIAGRHRFRVRLMAENDPATHTSAIVELAVGSGTTLSINVRPTDVAGPQATFHITFLNHMAWPAALTLDAHDSGDELRFRTQPEGPVVVPAGGESALTVRAVPKVRGRNRERRTFDVEFRGLLPGREDSRDALVQQARFTYVPGHVLPRPLVRLRRAPITIVLLLLVLVLLGVAGERMLAVRSAATRSARPVLKHVTAPKSTAPGAGLARGSARAPAAAPLHDLLLNPVRVDFGAQRVHTTSAAQVIHLVNLGPAPLTITNITIVGSNAADFAARATCTHVAIAVDAGCAISVTFTPGTPGPRNAGLIIDDTAAHSPQSVPLSGTNS